MTCLCRYCCSKRHSCFGIDPVFMSRPTSSIRYGACAVHRTLPPAYPVSICTAKRSPFTGATLPPAHLPRSAVDPLELVGFAADSPPPPPPPDDGPTPPAWVLLTGHRRPSTENGVSATFGRCRGPPSTLQSRRTTGTGPVGIAERRCRSLYLAAKLPVMQARPFKQDQDQHHRPLRPTPKGETINGHTTMQRI